MQRPRRRFAFLLGPALLAAAGAAWAQTAPTAASTLNQLGGTANAPASAPAPSVALPSLPVEMGKSSPDDATIAVRGITFSGTTVFTAEQLQRQSGWVSGERYTLGQLRAMAGRITSFYRAKGYLLAQTLLPAQDVTDGIVQFAVLEGRYGQISLDNQSRVQTSIASGIVEGLGSESAATDAALERRLLLLNELPGVRARSTLRPGTAPGTADVAIALSEGPRSTGSLELDNQGNHYTGAYRVGASWQIHEPLGFGDAWSVRALTAGDGLYFGRTAYQASAGVWTLGLAASSLHYELGGAFANLQARGGAQTGTIFAQYPWLRQRGHQLTVRGSWDHKELDDRTGGGSPSQALKTLREQTLGLQGSAENLARLQVVQYNLSTTWGSLELRDASTRSNDASTAQSEGNFTKWNYHLSWLQRVSTGQDMYLSLSGQLASKNLDAAEKFSLGGATGVRAYPSGEASGDEGALLTIESRLALPRLTEALGGKTQGVLFVDAGVVAPNKYPWDSSAATRRSLNALGVGLQFTSAQQWIANAYLAAKLGDESAKSAPDAPWRLWLQAARFF